MAGDRGLAFVVIGLIGISAFWVSNQGRIEPRPAHAHTSQIVSATNSSSVNTQLQATSRDLSDGDTEETGYVFPQRDQSHGGAAMLGYPELSTLDADAFSRLEERLRLLTDAELAPPID